MNTVTMSSDHARINWRDTIDAALAGGEVVIERYHKPIAVVVNYAQWQQNQRRLKEFELWAAARRISDEMNANPKKVVSFAEHKRKMEARGMVYELGDRVQPGS